MQLTLDQVIARLEHVDPETVLLRGFGRGRSYRGRYTELAFSPASDVRVGDMLAEARAVRNTRHRAYGGAYLLMTGETYVNIAGNGDCSRTLGGDALTAERLGALLAVTTDQPAQRFVPRQDFDLGNDLKTLREMQPRMRAAWENSEYSDELQETLVSVETAISMLCLILGEEDK